MVMLISAILFIFLFIVALSMLWHQQDWQNYSSLMVLLWICFAGALFLAVVLSILAGFHFYLICHSTTTFEFITGRKAASKKDSYPARMNQTEETVFQVTAPLEELTSKIDKGTKR
jgi:hypothetical protein